MVLAYEKREKINTPKKFVERLIEYGFDRTQRRNFYEVSGIRRSRLINGEQEKSLTNYAEALGILVKRSGLDPDTINRLVRNWVRQRAFDLNVADVVSSADFYDCYLKHRRLEDTFSFKTADQGMTVFDQLHAGEIQAELMDGSN